MRPAVLFTALYVLAGCGWFETERVIVGVVDRREWVETYNEQVCTKVKAGDVDVPFCYNETRSRHRWRIWLDDGTALDVNPDLWVRFEPGRRYIVGRNKAFKTIGSIEREAEPSEKLDFDK